MKNIISVVIVVISFMMYKTNFIFNENKTNNNVEIRLKQNDNIIKLDLEEYLIGVVACEMPASFYKEALKAQAVASRTFALSRIIKNKKYIFKGNTSDQCYITKTDLKTKWGDNYNKRYNKIKDAVESTKGEYLTYKDKAISALFFSMSNGYTENSEDVFVSKRAYLKSVSSPNESEYKNYVYTVNLKKNDVKKKLNLKNDITSIKIISRFKTNRVKYIKVNENLYSGVEFRKLLNLRSADFDIELEKDNIIITTRGCGHGVGMSQYGANSMAKLGYSYDEILKHYYQKIEIKMYN